MKMLVQVSKKWLLFLKFQQKYLSLSMTNYHVISVIIKIIKLVIKIIIVLPKVPLMGRFLKGRAIGLSFCQTSRLFLFPLNLRVPF